MSAVGFSGYPIAAVQVAKKLRAGGETLREISDYIEEQYGVRPSSRTVSDWTSKRAAARSRAGNRRRHQRNAARGGITGGRLGRKEHRPEFRVARMAALRAEGMRDAAIAQVMTFDYQEQYTASSVSRMLGGLGAGSWRSRATTMLKAAPDLTHAEVARRVGVSSSSVCKFRKAEGL